MITDCILLSAVISMNPSRRVRILFWHLRKHGLLGMIRTSASRFVRTFRNKEAVFVYDLQENLIDGQEGLTNLTIKRYGGIDDIPENEMAQLIQLKGEDLILRFLRSFFDRGAHLWIARLESDVVGVQWTIVGGFNGFYSMPISKNEIIVCAVEVFFAFRGRGIWPAMINSVNAYHKKQGFARSYVKVKLWNKASLRSIGKTNARRIGTVRAFSVWSKDISIWDRKSLEKVVKNNAQREV